MRKRSFVGAAIAALAACSAVVPAAANAACAGSSCGSTNVTFAIASGSLTLSVPSSVDFSSTPFTPSATSLSFSPTWPSGSPVVVTDNRTLSLGWTDTVSSLTTWTGTNTNTMATGLSTLDVSAGCQAPVGTLTVTKTPVTLATGGLLMSAVATGVNSISCVPTLTIVVPPTATPDTYTGTITQTVA
jgi:hypothetical protein